MHRTSTGSLLGCGKPLNPKHLDRALDGESVAESAAAGSKSAVGGIPAAFLTSITGPSKQKRPHAAAFRGGKDFSFPLFSEYQTQRGLLPGLGRYFGVEVVLYQRLLLSSGGEGLDTISTGARRSA
jgi:hypothetical protein